MLGVVGCVLCSPPSPKPIVEGDLAEVGHGHVAPVESGEDDGHGDGVATHGQRAVVGTVRVQQAVALVVVLHTAPAASSSS